MITTPGSWFKFFAVVGVLCIVCPPLSIHHHFQEVPPMSQFQFLDLRDIGGMAIIGFLLCLPFVIGGALPIGVLVCLALLVVTAVKLVNSDNG